MLARRHHITEMGKEQGTDEAVLRRSRQLEKLLHLKTHCRLERYRERWHGPAQRGYAQIEQCKKHDKPNVLAVWIIQGVIIMIRKGLLDVPPPLISRIFQEMSNGMLGFNQAHKVAMVPFPFPFAQMVSWLLMILYVFMPFYIDLFTQNPGFTPLACFLLPMVYCALNTISVELEEPFGTDDNDVDIEIRHEDFLWLLVDVLRAPKTPPTENGYDLERSILRGIARKCPPGMVPPEMTEYVPDMDALDELGQADGEDLQVSDVLGMQIHKEPSKNKD